MNTIRHHTVVMETMVQADSIFAGCDEDTRKDMLYQLSHASKDVADRALKLQTETSAADRIQIKMLQRVYAESLAQHLIYEYMYTLCYLSELELGKMAGIRAEVICRELQDHDSIARRFERLETRKAIADPYAWLGEYVDTRERENFSELQTFREKHTNAFMSMEQYTQAVFRYIAIVQFAFLHPESKVL